jgi:hypothetical protein
MQLERFKVGDLAAVTATTAARVGPLTRFSLEVSGTFVGTVQLQGSRDNEATWESIGAALTAAGTANVDPNYYTHVRANCTAYTSGTITVTGTGRLD